MGTPRPRTAAGPSWERWATPWGQLDPAFDPRSYGFKQLSQLIKSRPDRFVVREDRTDGGPLLVYVQLKQ